MTPSGIEPATLLTEKHQDNIFSREGREAFDAEVSCQ
jgi:hypothetical protein